MKNLFKTSLFALLLSGSLTAQTNFNDTDITTVETLEYMDGQTVTVQTQTQEMQPLVTQASDMYKVNQDVVSSPIYVEETILIDANNDAFYEKEITMSYTRESEQELEYNVTADGVFVRNTMSQSNFIQNDGSYEINTDQFEDVSINVETISNSKEDK